MDNVLGERRTSGVSLEAVSKWFGNVKVLHDIDLDIQSGEFVVFVGPSGCGKSTLLRLIAGLEEVTEGEIRIGGRDVTDADPSNRGIAMVFQTYALYPHMSVAENMGFGLKVAGRPKQEIAGKVAAAADVLRLTDYLDRRPGQLSGGQRQRVAIGRAIVRDPDVFLFDEPLSNLDAELRVEMRIEIARLHQSLGNTMIYVTHDQTEAMTLADKIVVLRGGRIEQVGSPTTLYDDPDNLFVAGFIGSPKMNFLPAEVREGAIRVGGHPLPDPGLAARLAEGTRLQVGIRPEHLRPAEPGEPAMPLTAQFAEFLGGTTYLYGIVGEGLDCVMEVDRSVDTKQGNQLNVTAAPDDIRCFGEDGLRIR
ncbi:ABC transporter ATP-binding protein [Tropicimonas sp. IMCC6043]|uniref:ABC transporter ATP-binding protein n=1 Tax=Tropicimonas sp. IMCC6043 TaxID=2510645 RepID=UPI00101E0847|nr:sn-glycerol-3-phosphate ABC transporter ATP-binding protein UgpC [Tropicimonas sp. IMCC6043]RYH08459.1 sn-glycerol-3-phosphate ABC transporter ATP-binding protein UgpC [Tropicimonas sp. IMCC6043]